MSISNNFSNFLYHLESEQLLLFFAYFLFQVHFSTDSLSFLYPIKILFLLLFLHSFFNLPLSIPNYNIFQIPTSLLLNLPVIIFSKFSTYFPTVFFPSLVWEFKWEEIEWVGGNTHSSLFS